MRAHEAVAELQAKIRAREPAAICGLLDALEPSTRVEAVTALGARDQSRLWRCVDGFRPVRLVDLVPEAVPDLSPVRHHGRNSMPAFTRFEKRFYRAPGADPRAPDALGGANFQTISPLTGPGYFVAVEHRERPEVLIDYRRLPAVAPSGWPAIRDNEHGLPRLVYGFMVDTLRRVSEHVTIGSAARHGRDIGAFFVLCRQDPLP